MDFKWTGRLEDLPDDVLNAILEELETQVAAQKREQELKADAPVIDRPVS